jgi:hypothetical protein
MKRAGQDVDLSVRSAKYVFNHNGGVSFAPINNYSSVRSFRDLSNHLSVCLKVRSAFGRRPLLRRSGRRGCECDWHDRTFASRSRQKRRRAEFRASPQPSTLRGSKYGAPLSHIKRPTPQLALHGRAAPAGINPRRCHSVPDRTMTDNGFLAIFMEQFFRTNVQTPRDSIVMARSGKPVVKIIDGFLQVDNC